MGVPVETIVLDALKSLGSHRAASGHSRANASRLGRSGRISLLGSPFDSNGSASPGESFTQTTKTAAILSDSDTDRYQRAGSMDRRGKPDGAASAAIDGLLDRGHELAVASQNLVKLWSVCTRPADVGGLGLNPAAAAFTLDRIEQEFVRLRGTDGIYPAWRRLVREHGVSGRQVHDARLVASMLVNGITHILTFNGRDFLRYAQIFVIDPLTVE